MTITIRSSTAATLLVLALAPFTSIRPTAGLADEVARDWHHPFHKDSLYRQSVQAREGDSLSLRLVTRGSVSIHGWAEPRVDMEAMLGGDATSRAIGFGRTDDAVALTLNTPDHRPESSASYALGLRVPREMNISLESANGPVSIDDVPIGAKHVHLLSGDITVAGAATGGDFATSKGNIVLKGVAGDVTASTSRGTVKLIGVYGNVVAQSAKGDVHIVVAGSPDADRSISVHAASGNVVIDIPDSFPATLDLESVGTAGRAAPRIESDWPLATTTGSRADTAHQRASQYEHADAVIGSGGMRVTIRTDGGSITVRRAGN